MALDGRGVVGLDLLDVGGGPVEAPGQEEDGERDRDGDDARQERPARVTALGAGRRREVDPARDLELPGDLGGWLEPGAAPVRLDPGPAAWRAARMASALSNRSSGRFASARCTTAAKAGDTSGQRLASGAGSSWRWAESTAMGWGATKGGRPPTIS